MNKGKMKVIGICGPSCSGKSTVSDILSKRLGADVLCLDGFYIKGSKKHYIEFEGKKFRTFERPELYNGRRLADCIRRLAEKKTIDCDVLDFKTGEYNIKKIHKKDYLIIDGFLLYLYKELSDMIDYRFFIDLPFKEVVSRRKKRGGREKSDGSFLKIGEIEYNRFGSKQKQTEDVIFIDGKNSQDEIVGEIISRIKD